MARIDVARLRKDRGMSQIELAQQLQITQSFLSAIENGKSPLPPEKEARILELFSIGDITPYLIDNQSTQDMPGKGLEAMSDTDLLNQLLSRFHEHAHRKDSDEDHHGQHHDRITVLEERNDMLMARNDSLAAKNDALRDEIDRLRDEIVRLRILLADNGIKA